MAGDRANDAPTLAAASLGVGMGAIGSDVVIETGTIVLMLDELSQRPWLVQRPRKTLATIQRNGVFTPGLKAFSITLARAGISLGSSREVARPLPLSPVP